MKNFETPIKWSGSKKSQAKEICSFINKNYDIYYEHFCGGCSMLFYILNNIPYRFNRFICNDINKPLIDLYKLIMINWEIVQRTYEKLWLELNKNNDLERKKAFFNKVRAKFNDSYNPDLFFFIMRTTTNGMPRYNKNGDFNNSFHVTHNGMNPSKTVKILKESSDLLNLYKVVFISESFENISTTGRDLIYLDPPYFNTKGMYYGTINYNILWTYLKETKSDWLLSFDGKAGKEDNTVNIPNIYNNHIYINSGNSSFRRVIGKSKSTVVEESLYIRINKG